MDMDTDTDTDMNTDMDVMDGSKNYVWKGCV